MVRGGVVGIEFDGTAILLFGGTPIPVVILRDDGQGDMGFREVVIQLDGGLSGGPRFG